MKRIIVLSLSLMLMLTSFTMVFAEEQGINVNDGEGVIELLIGYKDDNNELIKSRKLMTKEELIEYKNNKNKFLLKNAKSISTLLEKETSKKRSINKKNIEQELTRELLKENLPILNNNLDLIGTRSNTNVTNRFDFGVIETNLQVYDISNSGECYKRVLFEFTWHDDPNWFYNDAIGIMHTGFGIGYTNYRNLQCRVINKWGMTFNHDSDVEFTNNGGVKSKFFLRDGSHGYLTFEMGNSKNAIPANSDIVVYGKYGHTYVGLGGINVTFGTGGLDISGALGSFVKQTSQLYKNNINSY